MRAAERIGLIDDEDIVIDEAALELSAMDHPGLDIAPYLARLSDMRDRLAGRDDACQTAEQRARSLAVVVAREAGLTGDRTDFDNPANADLVSVLDRRRGLPVALAILYVGLARRLGWHVDALNTPGRILTRVGREPSAVIQDPFDDGAILGADTIALRLGGRDVRPSVTRPSPLSNRSILLRLLNNAAARALQKEELERALALYERMTELAPAFPALWWERARIENQLGKSEKVRASLAALLETTRDRSVRAKAAAALATFARPTG